MASQQARGMGTSLSILVWRGMAVHIFNPQYPIHAVNSVISYATKQTQCKYLEDVEENCLASRCTIEANVAS